MKATDKLCQLLDRFEDLCVVSGERARAARPAYQPPKIQRHGHKCKHHVRF